MPERADDHIEANGELFRCAGPTDVGGHAVLHDETRLRPDSVQGSSARGTIGSVLIVAVIWIEFGHRRFRQDRPFRSFGSQFPTPSQGVRDRVRDQTFVGYGACLRDRSKTFKTARPAVVPLRPATSEQIRCRRFQALNPAQCLVVDE